MNEDTVLLGAITGFTGIGVTVGLYILKKLDNLCERLSRVEGKLSRRK